MTDKYLAIGLVNFYTEEAPACTHLIICGVCGMARASWVDKGCPLCFVAGTLDGHAVSARLRVELMPQRREEEEEE